MSEWKEYKLGEACDITTGFAFKGEEYESSGNLKVVRGENVTIGKLRWDIEKHWNKSTESLSKYFLDENDIVIGMDGSRVGQNRAIIRKADLPLILAQRVARLKAKDGFDQKYLWYNVFSNYFKEYVEAIHTGTSIPHISQKQIADFEFAAPSKSKQTSIAETLSSFDDKLDLLHRQNKTLEQMAETLFRQWFVEEAEDGWEDVSLFDTINLVGGGTPKTSNPDFWNGDIKWLSGGDISNNHKGFVTDTEKTITLLGLENSSAKLLPAFATVISARGTVGKYCILTEPMAFSQSNYGIVPKIENCFFFTYLLVSHSVDELQAAAYGSVFDTITTNTFREHKIRIPEVTAILNFENSIASFFYKIKSNTIQIKTLTQLRDTLLPKLLSGEVRVDI